MDFGFPEKILKSLSTFEFWCEICQGSWIQCCPWNSLKFKSTRKVLELSLKMRRRPWKVLEFI